MADRKVIDSIIRIGQQRGEPRKRILAALATGKVESNFQNLSHGDADSQGWRQERASLYKDPTNLQASINRFYDEARKFDRAGLSAGELAARVQRPAAQFRGRYAQALPAVQGLLGGSTPRLLTTKRTVPGELIAGAAGMSLTTPGISFDARGYDEARRKSILGEMVAKRNPNSILLRSGLLTTTEPSTADFTKETSSTTRIAGLGSYRIPSSTSTSTRLVGGGGGSRKIVRVDGKPVLGWLAQAIAYARANGWRGTVTSGVRTPSEQIGAATRFGLQHYGPAGPLGSNHVTGHDGAIDVTDPSGFERALRGYRGKKPIRRMRDDPVHFSANGH
jgi:hypothetical protein